MKIRIGIPDQGDVEIEARPGWTVMEALRDAGLPIAARCGGGCACASCHVHVDLSFFGTLPEISEDETDLLESSDSYEPAASRLSCQLICKDELDGLIVRLQPDSLED